MSFHALPHSWIRGDIDKAVTTDSFKTTPNCGDYNLDFPQIPETLANASI
jgi:hypothetical protein